MISGKITLRIVTGMAFLSVLLFGISTFIGLNGLLCNGMNGDLGTVAPGGKIASVIRLTNLSQFPITILEDPTCGCEVTPHQMVVVGPFQQKTLRIPYRVSAKEKGLRTRTIILYAQHRDTAIRLSGKVTFLVR